MARLFKTSIVSEGNIAAGTVTSLGRFTSIPGGATTIGAVIRGVVGQSANLQEWQTSVPTTVASISPTGKLTSAGVETSSGITFTGANSPVVLGSNHGTVGQVLTSQGTANTPIWTNPGGSSGFSGAGTEVSSIISTSSAFTIKTKDTAVNFQNSPALTIKSGDSTNNGTAGRVTITNGAGSSFSSPYINIYPQATTPGGYLYLGVDTSLVPAAKEVTIDTFYENLYGEDNYLGVINIGQTSYQTYIGSNNSTNGNPKYIGIGNSNIGFTGITIGASSGGVSVAIGTGTSAYTTIGSLNSTQTVISGFVAQEFSAPLSKSAAGTLTTSEMKSQIIRWTGGTATLTTPTGAQLDGIYGSDVNWGWEFSVINTGTGTVTVGLGSGITGVGTRTVASATSARFRIARTGLSAWSLYRMS